MIALGTSAAGRAGGVVGDCTANALAGAQRLKMQLRIIICTPQKPGL
ncbi:VENN motif pre-toxin domain-containing protein [Pantoea sp. Marseille-Q5743]|nr:VENN motif pre-toxin domain-containing protein [Pantoea sp. Marseille-Q5743]UIL52379.1 VENN motif pre-toxin domain-containing protein [Pantoea agglomerans]